MSYWASNRPATPKAHAVRRKQQTGAMESSKEVWDYGFHNETFKTTNLSDYTDKSKELGDRHRPREDPRDHLWMLGFDNAVALKEERIASSPVKPRIKPESNFVTTNGNDFSGNGFIVGSYGDKPAGRPTPSNRTGLQYSSDKLIEILKTAPKGPSNIFLPPDEQCKRIGIQTWTDFPQIYPERVKDFAERDIELMRNKTSASLTITVAGK